MKDLRISSSLNLHAAAAERFCEKADAGLAFLSELGFDAANLDLTSPLFAEDGWQSEIEAILKTRARHAVKIELAHLPFFVGKRDDEFLRHFALRMKNAIDAAVMLGVSYAVLHPNTTTVPQRSFQRAAEYDAVLAWLSPIAEYAASVGLPLAVENMRVVGDVRPTHRYCQEPDELCEIVDAIGASVCWDFGHANISGLRQSEALSYVGRRLAVLHVNDNDGIGDDHILPFAGTVDWKDAMHGLALADFNGLFNYEIAASRVPAPMRRVQAEYLLSAARTLMSYIE